jgi:CysZ protein
MNSFITGFNYMLSGFSLIKKPRLRRFVAIPLAINILLFAGLVWFAFRWIEKSSTFFMSKLPGWLDWLNYLIWPLFIALSLLIIFYGFSIIANLIAAPFNGLLAEAVENHLRNEPLTGSWQQVLRDVLPAIWSEIRKLLYFLLRAIPLGLLFLIPVINIAAPFLWGAFSVWMLAIQYADYPMANHQLFFKEQRRRLAGRRMLALGFGSGVLLFTLIPVLNFAVMPAAVAGATAMWVNENELAPTRKE